MTLIRTILYGADGVGAELLRLLLQRPDIQVVGVIDPRPQGPAHAGELPTPSGIEVSCDAESVLRNIDAEVVLHSNHFGLAAAYPEILGAVSAQKHVVSSSAELVVPGLRFADIAQKVALRARESGVWVLTIGSTMAFVTSVLALVSAAACQQVRSVRVGRLAAVRPEDVTDVRRAGIGLSPQGFQVAAASAAVGHTGLREAVAALADTLGWPLDDLAETIEPVLAARRIKTDHLVVEKGYVMGIRQAVRGLMAEHEVVRLELHTSLGILDPLDEILVDGTPSITLRIPGGVPDESTTAALMVNCIPAVLSCEGGGLLSLRDMPIAPYRVPQRRIGSQRPEVSGAWLPGG